MCVILIISLYSSFLLSYKRLSMDLMRDFSPRKNSRDARTPSSSGKFPARLDSEIVSGIAAREPEVFSHRHERSGAGGRGHSPRPPLRCSRLLNTCLVLSQVINVTCDYDTCASCAVAEVQAARRGTGGSISKIYRVV